jgi:dihydrofolate reductase
MKIRTHIGISVDGYVSTRDGRPTVLLMRDFRSGVSHGHPEFIADCGAVVMGRTTFEPAVGAGHWPWPGLQVYVLTSRPLPQGTPDGVVASDDPRELLQLMRAGDFSSDVHLVGGPETIQAFHEIGALDRLELIVLPVALGDGLRLVPSATGQMPLTRQSQRGFPDGSIELVYDVGSPNSL